MSKKQKLNRAIALSMVLAGSLYCQAAFAADGTNGNDANDPSLTLTDSNTNATITYTATNGQGFTMSDNTGDNGGHGGSTSIVAGSSEDLSNSVDISATGGAGGSGAFFVVNSKLPYGGSGGHGGSAAIELSIDGSSVTHQAVTLTATGGNGGNAGKGDLYVYSNSDYTEHTGGNAGDGGSADLSIRINTATYVADDITLTAQGGNGGDGGSANHDDNATVFYADINKSGQGGSANAIGVLLTEDSIASSITAADILITATGGNGGDTVADSNYSTGALGGIGGSAEAYGIKLASLLKQEIVTTVNSITVTAVAGDAGANHPIVDNDGKEPHSIGPGAAGTAYGIHNQTQSSTITVNGDISVDASGGTGLNGYIGKHIYGAADGLDGGTGGTGGVGTAYGLSSASGVLSVTADTIQATATGGNGGNGGDGGNGGNGGDGGNGGNGGDALAYGSYATNHSQVSISTDSIKVSAAGGAKGTAGTAGTSGTAGSDGVAGQDGNATAYGVYASGGSVVTLAGKSGNTLDIGVTATGTDAKAYSVYADGATVLFDSSANINKNATLTGTDNDIITYLNNATFGFTGTDADRTITGGTLNLQGSNTFIVNTDLSNGTPTADKITFDSLAAGSSTATQYITVGYDPAIDPANLGSVDLSNNLEIFEITTLAPDQNLNNFQAKTNILDSALYKFTVTPEIGLDASGNKLEISSITTAKLALPSESVMTAADTMTGMSGIWRIEGNNLMKRMGDLRSDPEAAKGGVWARYYRGDLSASSSYGRSLNQDYTAFQGGIDKVQPYHSGRLYTGIAVNHIDANSSYSMGRGEGSSTGVGLYTSWIGDKGHYVDVILRASRLNSNFKLTDTSGNHINADYSTWAYGISGEYGYRHKMQAGWFVEPQAELSFGHINGVSYSMSNGAKMDNSAINSLTARLGFVLGKEFKTAQRPGNVYLKGSLYHEFGGKGSLTGYYNNDYIHADGSPNMGTWYELGIGTNLGIAKNSNLYIDALKTFGGKINTKWQLNAGVRVNF